MAKRPPTGPPRPFHVVLNGYPQEWDVDACDADAAIDTVLEQNPAVKLRDRRNFHARLRTEDLQPPRVPAPLTDGQPGTK